MKKSAVSFVAVMVFALFSIGLAGEAEARRRAPVLSLSPETVEIIIEVGKDYNQLEATAVVDDNKQVTGYVNQDYEVCFEDFLAFGGKRLSLSSALMAAYLKNLWLRSSNQRQE